MAVAISVVGLMVAFSTLYLTQLRRPVLRIFIGSRSSVHHSPGGGGLSFYFTMTVVNNAARTGTVLRTRLALSRNDEGAPIYRYSWRSFSDYNPDLKRWQFREIAHPIAVAGHSSEFRTIWFSWPDDLADQPHLDSGLYKVEFEVEEAGRSQLHRQSHMLAITDEVSERLGRLRALGKATVLTVSLDERGPDHAVIVPT